MAFQEGDIVRYKKSIIDSDTQIEKYYAYRYGVILEYTSKIGGKHLYFNYISSENMQNKFLINKSADNPMNGFFTECYPDRVLEKVGTYTGSELSFDSPPDYVFHDAISEKGA